MEDEINISTEELSALLHKHRPVVYLNETERHFPCSVEFFIESSELQSLEGDNWRAVPLPENTVENWTVESILDYQSSNPTAKTKLCPKRQFWEGQIVNGTSPPPIYGYAEQLPKTSISSFFRNVLGRVVDLKYAFLYAYNPSIFRIPPFKPFHAYGGIGSHLGDIEHVLVRVDADSGNVLEVFFGCHSTEGKFCSSRFLMDLANEHDPDSINGNSLRLPIEFDEDETSRPIIFSALSSHASYPQGRDWHRFTINGKLPGFADDICSKNTIIWKPDVVEMDHVDASFPNWLSFRGYFGKSNNFCRQRWWNVPGENPSQVSMPPKNLYHSVVERGLIFDRP